MSHNAGPSRDDMRRVQDQFLELPQVVQFVRKHGENMPIDLDRPTVGQIRGMLYPEMFWWFQECVDKQEMQP